MTEQTQNTKIPKKRNWRRKLIKLLIIFTLTAINLEIIMYFFAAPLFKTSLQTLIRYKTNHLYELDFDSLVVEMTARSVNMTNFRLTPDTAVYRQVNQQGKPKTALYDIRVQSFHIERLSLYRLVFDDVLYIKKLSILKPEIRLIGIPATKKRQKGKYDAVHDDLYPAIAPFFKALDIKKIELVDGYFDLYIQQNDKDRAAVVNNITIVLEKFYLDYDAYFKREKLFFSQNIEFSSRNYKVVLNDKIHTLKASLVSLSTSTSEIKAQDVNLFPEQLQKSDSMQILKNCFNILVPQISIKGFDLAKVYFDQQLDIHSIELQSPRIMVLNRQPRKKIMNFAATDSLESDLYKMISGKFENISVDTFLLSNCQFQTFRNLFGTKPVYDIGSLSISLFNFFLNKDSYQATDKILLSENIELQIKKFSMQLADNLHILKANELNVSTEKKRILAKGVYLYPLISSTNSLPKGKSMIKVNAPYLDLFGIDLIRAYNKKQLPIYQLLLSKLEVSISRNYDSTEQKSQKRINNGELYNLTSAYLRSINISKLVLQNGSFNVSTFNHGNKVGYISGVLSFELERFQLDPLAVNTEQKLFYANDANIVFENYAMKPVNDFHIIKADNLTVSTKNSTVSVNNFSITPEILGDTIQTLKDYNKSSVLNITIKNMNLQKADVHNAYFEKKLRIGNFFIEQPSISVLNFGGMKRHVKVYQSNESDSMNTVPKDTIFATSDSSLLTLKDTANFKVNVVKYRKRFYEVISDYFSVIAVDKLTLDSGLINIVNKDSLGRYKASFNNQIFINLKKFYVGKDTTFVKKRFFFSDDISVRIKDYSFNLPDNVHVLKVNEFGFSTEKRELYGNGLKIDRKFSYDIDLKKSNTVSLSVPDFKLHGINIQNFLDNKLLEADTVIFDYPAVTLTKHLNVADEISRRKHILPKGLKGIKIGVLLLNKGSYQFAKEHNMINNIFTRATGNIQLKDFSFNAENLEQYGNMVKFSESAFQLKNFIFHLPDSIHFVKSPKIDFNSVDSLAVIQNFECNYDRRVNHVAQLRLQGKANLIEMKIPQVKLWGFSPDSLLQHKSVDIQRVSINSPSINILSYPAFKTGDSTLLDMNLFLLLKGKIKAVKAGKIDFKDAYFKIDKILPDTNTTFVLKNMDGTATKFLIDSASQTKHGLLFAEDISATIKDYKIPFQQDTLLQIDTREIGLSTKTSRVWIRNLNAQPDFEKSEFAQTFGFQKSALYATFDRLDFYKFDIPLFLKKRHIKSNKLIIKGMSEYTYLDKQLPKTDTSKIRYMPQDFIKRMKLKFILDTVTFTDSYIGYEELGSKANLSSTLSLENVFGVGTNICNDSLSIQQNKMTRIRIVGNIMGKSQLTMFLKLPLNSTTGEHHLGGAMDTVNMAYFNPFLENLAFVSIRDGVVKSLRVSMKGSTEEAEGTMRMFYNKLKVNVMEKSAKDSVAVKSNMTTMLANTLIPSDNPRSETGILKEGQIYAARNEKISIISLWSKALMSGMKSSMGFESKELKKKEKFQKRLLKKRKKEGRKKLREEERQKKELEQELK